MRRRSIVTLLLVVALGCIVYILLYLILCIWHEQAESIPMGVWVPEEDALHLCRAILRLFRDLGARGDRQKARLMWLIEQQVCMLACVRAST